MKTSHPLQQTECAQWQHATELSASATNTARRIACAIGSWSRHREAHASEPRPPTDGAVNTTDRRTDAFAPPHAAGRRRPEEAAAFAAAAAGDGAAYRDRRGAAARRHPRLVLARLVGHRAHAIRAAISRSPRCGRGRQRVAQRLLCGMLRHVSARVYLET